MTIFTIVLELDSGRREMRLDLDLERDRFILDFLERGALYEPDVSTALLRILRPGDTAVDVGANLGYFTMLMAAITGPGGHVLSFEPGEDNVVRLADNVRLNAFDNVQVIPQPVSDRSGPVTFFLNSDVPGGHALWDPGALDRNVRSKASPQPRNLLATTLDETLAEAGIPPPRVIKIDTEGAEHAVLKGARSLLERHAVPFIIAELHGFGLEKLGSSQRSLRDYMAGFGYETFGLYANGALPKMFPRGTEIRSQWILNLLFSSPDDVASVWRFDDFDCGIIAAGN